jgi:hypothetical protein
MTKIPVMILLILIDIKIQKEIHKIINLRNKILLAIVIKELNLKNSKNFLQKNKQ